MNQYKLICVEMDRSFIGIEKNAEYFALAKRRITAAQHFASLRLFPLTELHGEVNESEE